MKKQFLMITAILIASISQGQLLNHVSAKNEDVKLTYDDGTLSIKNITSFKEKIVLSGTMEDTVYLTEKQEKIIHAKPLSKVIGAKVIGSACNCWLQMVIDCSLLPIRISNIRFTDVGNGQIKVDFDAYNSELDGKNSFMVQYSKDAKTWQTVSIDVPEVTSLSQHFSRIIKIN
jgi:hypothetical protein